MNVMLPTSKWVDKNKPSFSEQSCEPLISGITFCHNVWSNGSNKSLKVQKMQVNY